MAFFVAPADYQQGETVRIMFLHVPAAWLALFFYTLMAASALGTLVWRHPLADVSQKAAAPIGAAFTLICLVTGSLWGKPMWGTYWVWDARPHLRAGPASSSMAASSPCGAPSRSRPAPPARCRS